MKILNLSIAILAVLLAVGCASNKEYKTAQTKLVDAKHQLELQDERINRFISERDAAKQDAERESTLRKELQDEMSRQRAELETINSRQAEEIKKLQQQRDLLQAKLKDADIQTLLECQEQVRSCKGMSDLKDAEHEKQIENSEELVAQTDQDCQQQITSCNEMVAQKEKEIRVRANAYRELVGQAEAKAQYRGMLLIWESLAVKATPVTEGLVFKDHFLNINVNVRGHSVYSFRVKTAGDESGFDKALSTVANITTIAQFVK